MITKYLFAAFCLYFAILDHSAASKPCAERIVGPYAMVCVCNATYCDTLDGTLPTNGILVLTSSRDGLRFQQGNMKLSDYVKRSDLNYVNETKTYQTIKGFGGALSDSAGINAMDLSDEARDLFIKSYFGSDGIEYNIVRVPMAACDFSTRAYTYLDTPNDFDLSTFALAPEDTNIKIPLLKQIRATSERDISLFASVWSAPAWMKTNDNVKGWGMLKGQAGGKYHKTWAQYFTKFFDAYKENGVEFWGVTMQNEPSNGLVVPGKWQCMGWTGTQQKEFIKNDLGPELHQKGYGDLKLMSNDDQRVFIVSWSKNIMSDPDAAKYISGIGIHWYWNWLIGPGVLDTTHNLFPDKFLLPTEACIKNPASESFGNWDDGERYSNDILDNLNNWAVGWVDWNIALNFTGGPNWVNNLDNSPIIVNGTANEFYKQPMYYHLGHFSKYIPEGSVRVESTCTTNCNELKYVAFLRPDKYYVVVALNQADFDLQLSINIGTDAILSSSVPKRSIQTYVWKQG